MSKSSLKSAGSKGAGSKSLKPNRLYAAVLLALSGQAMALPEGGQVVAGDAAISVSGDTMQILQNSQRAILNFQSFDISSQQTVNFQQPGADAVALNRVLGDRLSEIHGALNANGQIYLINPNGVLFGNGAEINVGSLVVTTLDIADQDFLAGRDAFSGSANGRVENRGRIDADGRVVLLAPEVINSGDINVPNGDIVLQSSRQALLHTPGSEIPILVEDADLIGRVVNEGTLTAGEVALILHSDKAQLAYDAAIDNSGLVRAVRASGEGGEIHLLSGAAIVNSGTLDASADTGAGGEITLTAEAINQSGQITAKAAGTGDGGTITLLADNAIAMHSGSTISADADAAGDGGEVLVIAERATWFTGDSFISARGGDTGGDGGFVEVSGHEFVSVFGNVDVGAAAGEGGMWLIDPTDITITNQDGGGEWVGGNWQLHDTPTGSLVNVASILNALNNGFNITISTESDASSPGNITFASGVTLNYDGVNAVRTLNLHANGSIIFENGSHISDGNINTVNGLNIIATAGTGFVLPDGSTIFAGTGKIDINVLAGDATFTGLGSVANAVDAIRVSANAGRLINAGASTWNLTVPGADAGIILSGRDGIENITVGNGLSANGTFVDAVSSGGDVQLIGESVFRINRLSTANFASVYAGSALWLTASAVLTGNSFQLSSSNFIALPDSGLTVAGTLTLLGADIVTESYGRTLTLGASDLVINTNAAGGNLQINSAVDTLSLTNGFSNTITVNDADALTLETVAPQAGAIIINSGAGTDLEVGEDLDLNGMAGSLTLGAGRNLLLSASISDTDGSGLTLNAPNSVIFAADSQVNAGTGNINITATSGNVELGRVTGGTVTINAGGSITDANGSGVNLSATSAILTAGTGSIGALADGLETSVGTLTLNSANGSAFISNSQALNLTSVNVGDDLNVSLPTAGNLTLNQSTPTIGGTATFSVANGQLIVPNTGWTTTGNLTVNATRMVDTNSSATVSLTANNADLTLTGAVASTLNVDFNTLALQLSGGSSQTVQVTDANALSISNLSNNGNLTVTTEDGSDLTITDTMPVSSGQLTLNVGRNLVLSTAGLNVTGNLIISADDMRDSNASSNVSLGAANADITLRDAAGARSWSTSFNQLVLDIAGTGNFELTDTDGLTLTSVDTGGNASFTTTGADLVLTTQLQVAGDLALRTTGAGNVVVPDARFAHVGNLVIDANDLLDTNRTLSLEATSADIRLRNPGGNHTWTTQLGSLALEMGGTADIQLTDEDGLTLTGLSVGGNATIGTTGADLVLLTAPDVDGVLSLTTTTSGDLVIDNDGLMHGGGLIIVARNIRNSDDSTITLGATNADITLRDGGQAQTWNTSFTQLALQIAGAGDFDLTDTDGLTLTAVSTGGNASFRTTGADLVLNSTPDVDGALTLATVGSGDVVIPNGGLQHTDELTITADNLRGSDADLSLSATTANITLRNGGAQARTWSTDFDELVLAITGTGDLNLTNDNTLILSSITTGGNASIATLSGGLTLGTGTIGGNAAFTAADGDLEFINAPTFSGDLSLTANSGAVIVDDAGLIVSGDLTIDAQDLRDSNADLTLEAATANITLSAAGSQARTWTTTFDELVLDITGTGDFELTNTGDLTLTSVTTGGNASFSTNGDLTLGGGSIGGNAAFTATNGDVVMTSAPTLTGDLSLTTVGSGDAIVSNAGLSAGGNLTVDADDLRDSDGGELTLAANNADITLRVGAPDRNWSTTFNDLVLSLTGAGDFSLNNTGALALSLTTTGGTASFTSNGDLTLNAGDIGGSAALTANNGNVELVTAPSVTGNLSLTTVGTGDVILSEDGLTIGGDLTVDADDLRDSDADVILAAATADITLRNEDTQARDWTTTFEELVLDIAGTGDFNLTNIGDLTVTSATTGGSATFATEGGSLTMGAGTIGGDASFSATDGDLVFANAPTVAGDLTLTTTGTGAVIVSDNGLVVGGVLTVDADDLRDGDADLTLTATSADITLRNTGSQARNWTTSFNELVLDIAGDGDFLLTDTDGLTLTSVTTGGNATFRTTNADLILDATPDVAGALSLVAQNSGSIVLPDAGLLHDGALTLVASNLIADSAIRMGATTANIALRDGAQIQSWNTAFDSLELDIAGSGDFLLTDADGLTLTSVSTGGNATFRTTDGDLVLQATPNVAGTLGLSTIGSGDIVLPDAGLLHAGDLTIDAENLVADDIILGAANADITLRDGSQAQSWTTSFETLVLAILGDGDFALTDTDGLTLASVTTGGNASFSTTNADLEITATPDVAGDLTLTTIGTGDLITPVGGLLHDGALTIEADNLVADDIILGATDATITLRGGDLAQSWNTSFDTLALTIDGDGDFALEDTDGLTLTSVTTGGNASFSTNNADLVLDGIPTVAGELSLLTLGSGNVILPNAGLLHNGDLRIVANDLGAAGNPLAMSAANAAITLRGGDTAQTWNTAFDRLALTIAGEGDFSLTDTDGLILTSVNTGGNASFRTTAADLVLSTAPVVAGDLHLETVGSGDLVLPTAGLAHNGKLTLVADQVRDNNTNISLSATELTADLRSHQQAAIWNTDVDRLDLTVAGGGALTLDNTGTLVIDNLVSDGQVSAHVSGNLTIGTLQGEADMAFSSDANLTLLNTTYDVDGELALTAANDLRLASGGLTVTDTMRLVAAQLTVAGGTPVVLAGTAADLTLTGTQALALTTRLGQLGLTYGGNSVSINNDRNLTINRWTAANADTVGLSVAGTLTLPAAGLAARERLTIDAVDLRERSLSLSAPELAVRLSGASGNHNWTVNADSLDVLMRGQANLQVNAANGLVLEDLNNDTQAVLVENGNFTLNLASGDLTLANTVSAADLTADGVRAGVIDLAVAQGSVRTRGAASLISTNLVDQDASGDAIRIRLTDTSANDRDITLGDTGNSTVTLRAIGGDILLDSRAAGTAEAAKRNVVQHSGVGIEAFDNPGDNLGGRVLINGEQVAAQPWQTVRTGRTLAIVTDVAPPPPPAGSVIDELDDLDDGSTEIIRDSDKSGPKAAAQFEQVFGTCDELDKKNRHRCRVDDALKSFLSHWLVGGELPPKTEIR